MKARLLPFLAMMTAFSAIIITVWSVQAQTCPPQPSACIQPRIQGYQPGRMTELREKINQAAAGTLGGSALSYPLVSRGLPPLDSMVNVSETEPLPTVLLRSLFWQESRWLQYANWIGTGDSHLACTLVAPDCGYGISQFTDCMFHASADSCSAIGINPEQIASDLTYNLSAGTRLLLHKWNVVPYIGANNHTFVEDLYYTTLAYNGYARQNDPNDTAAFDRLRPPYGVGEYGGYSYPYQEIIYGWMANPVEAISATPVSRKLWRETHYAQVPRGIFGLQSQTANRDSSAWEPPYATPRPQMTLVHNITRNSNGEWPVLIARNNTNQTLAFDLLFYNQEHSYAGRWVQLDNDNPYIRIGSYSTMTFNIVSAVNADFIPHDFRGYARIHASEGVTFELNVMPSEFVYLPAVTVSGSSLQSSTASDLCSNQLTNGGFEQLDRGLPVGWQVNSPERYPLVDATWFKSGHYGAHLGGHVGTYTGGVGGGLVPYREKLSASFFLPVMVGGVWLTFDWSIITEESANANENDILTVSIENSAGVVTEIGELRLSNANAVEGWRTISSPNLRRYYGLQAGNTYKLYQRRNRPHPFLH